MASACCNLLLDECKMVEKNNVEWILVYFDLMMLIFLMYQENEDRINDALELK